MSHSWANEQERAVDRALARNPVTAYPWQDWAGTAAVATVIIKATVPKKPPLLTRMATACAMTL